MSARQRELARSSVLTTAVCSGANKGSGPRIRERSECVRARLDMGVCPPLAGPQPQGAGTRGLRETTVLGDAPSGMFAMGHPGSVSPAITDPCDTCDPNRPRRSVPRPSSSRSPWSPRLAAGGPASGGHTPISSQCRTHSLRSRILGPEPLLAPEHTAVVSTDSELARAVGAIRREAYLHLRNYVDNLLRHGFTTEDVAGDGSDRLMTRWSFTAPRRKSRPGW